MIEVLCACGCGQPTSLAHQSDTKRGYVKGEPRRFIRGHHGRGMKRSREVSAKSARWGPDHHAWKGGGVSYSGVHQWARRNFPKTGCCEDCGAERKTEWANISGEHRRVRDDWLELCRSCHCKRDGLIKNITGVRRL